MNEGNNYKAKITTARGTFEFEGSQEYVEKQVDKVVDIEKGAPIPVPTPEPEAASKRKTQKSNKPSTKNGGGGKTASVQPKMLPNLVPKDQIVKLREYYEGRKPVSHLEKFAVMSYWLKDELSITEVSIDEMWTLYKLLQERQPKVLMQVFRDAKKKAWFDSAKVRGKYYLTSYGETFVEHDLPHISNKQA